MFIFNVGIFCRDFIEDFMKQTVSQFHDVVFGKAGDLLAVVATGVFESVTHNFFRAGPRNQLQALSNLLGLPVLNAGV